MSEGDHAPGMAFHIFVYRVRSVNEGVQCMDVIGTDRIPSITPGAEPPRDAKDSGSARSHSTHLETNSSNRP